MTPEPSPPRPIEDRLRAALSSRAEAVEPAPGDLGAIEDRVDDVRRSQQRRRVLLASAAAVVLAVVAVAGGLAIASDDDDTNLATGGQTPTTSDPAAVAPTDPGEPLIIWPLPSMSISYGDPNQAALAFADAYLGLEGRLCPRTPVVAGTTATVDIVNEGICAATGNGEPFGPATEVSLIQTGLGWAVTGATSNGFTAEVGPFAFSSPPTSDATTPPAPLLSTHVVATADLQHALSIELRPLGSMDVTARSTGGPPARGLESYTPLIDEIVSPHVLVVTDGTTAVASVVEPSTTEASPADPAGEHVRRGWPGDSSRVFDDAGAVALACRPSSPSEPFLQAGCEDR